MCFASPSPISSHPPFLVWQARKMCYDGMLDEDDEDDEEETAERLDEAVEDAMGREKGVIKKTGTWLGLV
jgi:hypothetical protein